MRSVFNRPLPEVAPSRGRRRTYGRTLTVTFTAACIAAAVAPAGGIKPSLGAIDLAAAISPVGDSAYVPVGTANLGPADKSAPLRLDVVLQPRDPAALTAFATAVSTPGNKLYQHFLSAGQFPALFGPTSSTIAADVAALQRLGLHTGHISSNHIILPVTTTIGGAEAAFHIGLESYRLATGRVAIGNTSAPRLPAAVAHTITAVIGLDTIAQAQPADEGALPVTSSAKSVTTAKSVTSAKSVQTLAYGAKVSKVSQAVPRTVGPQPCAAAKSAASQFTSWTENQLAQAYSLPAIFSRGDLGGGSTIALYELSAYTASDISTYQACYATHTPITNIPIDGGTTNTGGQGEVELDMEVVIGLAPAAKVDVYEAANSNTAALDEYNTIVSNDTAQVISSSWGECEVFGGAAQAKAQNTVFEQAATQGQSVFSVPGDEGAQGCLPNDFGTGGTGLGAKEGPGSVAIDPTTHTAYVSDYEGGAVSVVDDLDGALVGTISLGAGSDPYGVAVDPDTHKVFVTEQGEGDLAVINGATCNESTHTNCGVTLVDLVISTNPVVDGVAVNPTTKTVYVAAEGYDELAVISEASLEIVGGAAAGDEPTGVAVDVKTNEIYDTASGSNAVAVVSGADCDAGNASGCPSSPSGAEVGVDPTNVTVDASLGRIYVSNSDEGNPAQSSVSVLNAAGGGLVATIPMTVALEPDGSAISPSGTALLVATPDKGSAGTPAVTVISLKTNTVTSILSAGSGPLDVAVDPTIALAEVADYGDNALVDEPLVTDPWDPSTDPFVTGVGGTDLETLGPKPTERVWDETLNPSAHRPEGAGGGGISYVWDMPSYQAGLGKNSLSSGAPCGDKSGDCREIPDVSASADPAHGYVVFEQGQWTAAGGTSAATPLWAAITALLDIQQGILHRVGFLNPALYKDVAAGKPIVNDITTGNNDYTTTSGGLFPATKGYDMASGLGSPIGIGLSEYIGFEPLPIVKSISPSKGPAAGGTKIVIRGSGMMWVSSVKFGKLAAKSYVIVSPTEVTATSPAGTGTVSVTVTTPGGISKATAASDFTY